jgi:competence protein ComEA
MDWRRLLDGLRYNKQERQGLVILLLILFASIAYIWIREPGPSALQEVPEEIRKIAFRKLDSINSFNDSISKRQLFFFDPNKIDSLSLTRLGLSPFVAQRWLRFSRSGAYFYTPEDVLSVYGLDSNWWKRAVPYMIISQKQKNSNSMVEGDMPPEPFYFSPDTMSAKSWQRLGLTENQSQSVENYLSKFQGKVGLQELDNIYVLDKSFIDRITPFVIEKMDTSIQSYDGIIKLNSIDAEKLQKVTKWNIKLCERTIAYRNKLGGFYSTEQLAEVYGMELSLLDPFWGQWDFESTPIRPILLNRCTLDELAAHPYINFKQARTIIDFRDSVRPLKNLTDLDNMNLMSEENLAKLAPYLDFRL